MARSTLSLIVIAVSLGCHADSRSEIEEKLIGTWQGEGDYATHVLHLGADGNCWFIEDGKKIEGTYLLRDQKMILSWNTESDPNTRGWKLTDDDSLLVVAEGDGEWKLHRVANAQ